jgi:hypothetical protein
MMQHHKIIPLHKKGRHLVVSGLLIATLFVLSFAAGPMAASAQGDGGDTIARCEPLDASEWSGTSLSIEMYIENATDLYGADERWGFDPTGLQVVDTDAQTEGVQIEPIGTFLPTDYVIKKIADNDEGTVWYADTLMNPSEPVSGSGPIARVTFEAIRAGTYDIPVTYAKLSARDGTEIPSIKQDCTVTFWGPIDLVIHRVNGNNELSWSYLGSDIDHAEVWRSNTQPYLTPEGADAVLLTPGPAAGETTYTDTDAPTSVNQYYIVRAVKADGTTKSAPSNRVGAFHFALVPGSP